MRIEPNYVMNAFVTRVIDGDTVVMNIDPAFEVSFNNRKVRLYGIDTAELNSTDPVMRDLAQKARDLVKARVEGKRVIVRSVKNSSGADKIDSFGRYLFDVFYDEIQADGTIIQKSLNQELVDLGLAVPFKG